MSVPDKSAQAVVPEVDFAALYQAEFGHVWHTLRRFGVRERDLEDLCHDVFVAFYRSQDRYDATRPLKPWLSGIAFRVASDYRRRAQHRREMPSLPIDRSPSDEPPADEKLTGCQDRELLIEALAAVEEGRRAVLLMHDIDEQTMPQIAAVLGLPLNTAYSRLRLARAELTAAVNRLLARRAR